MGSPFRGTRQPLSREYDVALLDLDGVVYVGPDVVPGAAEALAMARDDGMHLAFVTNNAARPPDVVAGHLTELGIAAKPAQIITSAQAAARYLAERLPAGASVLVVGTAGLEDALRERGLVPVAKADQCVDAVVQGYSPDMSWRLLAEGAIAINRGVPWVATNVDATVPSARGPLPGNGSLVAALRHATRREPIVTGKPDPTMHRESVLRSGAEHPIVVGDRLDTDIEGANAAGCASLLVFTGVTTVSDLLVATPAQRPTYLSADLSGLLETQVEPDIDGATARSGDWAAARREDGRVELRRIARIVDSTAAGGGDANGEVIGRDAVDAVRAVCAALWSGDGRGNDQDRAVVVSEVRGTDADADAMVERLGLGKS